MSNIACCTKGLCEDPANPFANLSAEGPDPDLFIGRYHGSLQEPPPIDWIWGSVGCLTTCLSAVSQDDANLCAARQQFICTVVGCEDEACAGGDGEGGGGDGGWRLPGGGAPTIAANTAQSCNAPCPDGLEFTYTVRDGSVLQLNQASADAVAHSLACNRAPIAKVCLSSPQATACINQPYNSVVSVTGGTGPYTWAVVSGMLPLGLSINLFQGTDSQIISGVPTAAGDYSITLEVTDSLGAFMVKTEPISVMQITNTPPAAQVGQVYSFVFNVSGGTSPYTFALASGSLPNGLTLNPTGSITGIPTTGGTSNFSVYVTDSSS